MFILSIWLAIIFIYCVQPQLCHVSAFSSSLLLEHQQQQQQHQQQSEFFEKSISLTSSSDTASMTISSDNNEKTSPPSNINVVDDDNSLYWPPLVSMDGHGLDLLAIHPEPIRAVVDGEASCIIVRNVMSPRECEAVMARLIDRGMLGEGGLGPGTAALQYPFRRVEHLTDVGITIHGLSAEQWREAAPRTNALFEELFKKEETVAAEGAGAGAGAAVNSVSDVGVVDVANIEVEAEAVGATSTPTAPTPTIGGLKDGSSSGSSKNGTGASPPAFIDPIQRLHFVLNTLAGGGGDSGTAEGKKRVTVPEDMTEGVSGTGAIFRSHPPGQGKKFPPHFDGFQQGPIAVGSLAAGHRPFRVMHPSYSTRSVLSAILVLQTSEDENMDQDEEEIGEVETGDSRLFNVLLDDVLSLAEEQDQLTAESHWIGVHFDDPGFYTFADRIRAKRYSPQLRQGDLYLFSASRVHETFELRGPRCRVVVASFLAWHNDLQDIWLFQ